MLSLCAIGIAFEHHAILLDSYRLFKQVHEYEHYLSAVLPTKFRTALVKFRVSSHALLIESGRY
jgi:hypothetical protein